MRNCTFSKSVFKENGLFEKENGLFGEESEENGILQKRLSRCPVAQKKSRDSHGTGVSK
jgi:hypothetical protein